MGRRLKSNPPAGGAAAGALTLGSAVTLVALFPSPDGPHWPGVPQPERLREHGAANTVYSSMKTLIIVLMAVSLARTALAETYDVGSGTFEASEDFVFKHTGTKDSFMGTLTRKSDGFTITFDVGFMAGVHMSDSKKAKCTFYRRHSIGGIPASTGLESISDGQRITTSLDYDLRIQRPPANFWADIRKDSDIAEFMVIVTTYRPKSKDR